MFTAPSLAQGGGILNQGGTVNIIGGSVQQAVKLLVSNPADLPPACHFTGVVRGDDITPPFGSGLQDLVFEQPISLAPGESLALAVPFAPDPDISTRQELMLRIEDGDASAGPCSLIVGVVGYDDTSEATAYLIHRFTFGIERTFLAFGKVKSPLPLGFVGGNATQTARLIFSENGVSEVPSDARCEFTGNVIAETVPHHAREDQGIAKQSYPVKWTGPAQKATAVIDILFEELGAALDSRVDLLLSLQIDRPLPAACLKRINGSIQIFNQAGTQAVADRVFFNYHHFHNVP